MGTMEFSAQYQASAGSSWRQSHQVVVVQVLRSAPTPLPGDKVIISWDTALSGSLSLSETQTCWQLISNLPIVCAENLNTGVMVMKSAQDGA